MDALQLTTDRSHLDRLFAVTVALLALPVVLSVVLAVYFYVAVDAGAQVLVFAVPAVGLTPLVVAQCSAWAATRRIEHPLTVDAQGLTFDTPRGSVSFPWAAVTALDLTRSGLVPMLTVRLHPQAGPGAPGVASTLTPAGWSIVRRQGLRLSLRAVQVRPEELSAAVAHFSSGRWVPAPVASPA